MKTLTCTGTAHGNRIELDAPLPFPEGTRIRIEVVSEETPRKGSPRAWLQLVGTLSDEEAEVINQYVETELRKVDAEVWEEK